MPPAYDAEDDTGDEHNLGYARERGEEWPLYPCPPEDLRVVHECPAREVDKANGEEGKHRALHL